MINEAINIQKKKKETKKEELIHQKLVILS